MADRRSTIPNSVLRRVREEEFQMSRMEFAAGVRQAGEEMGEHVGCGPRLVAAWEDGEVDCPRAVYRRILTRMTGRSMQELDFRAAAALSAAADSTVPRPREERDPVDRRDVLRDGAGAVLGVSFAGGDPPGRIGATHVRAVTRAVATLYAEDHDHGSVTLRQEASRTLHQVYQWLQNGTCSVATERRLRTAVGSLSIAAGWLSFDSGRPGDAHSLYGEALAAARISGDPELEAHAFGCLSLLAKAQGRPREAVAAAQGAQTVARSLGSPGC
ncbi:hypothetical protein ABZT03_35285 [Streptomyces sp. NPDC005574]|uniref:hypothetical protein n=1 Tax=Streptomyces sp. NPDC005574 TaxID=3156891 RepID=UPI0033B35B99